MLTIILISTIHHQPITIIIIIIILVITFMQGIYNYMPETNHVSRVYNVGAALYLQFVLHVMLFHPSNMFCTWHYHFPQYERSAQYGYFLQFLNFVLSWYAAQVLSEWFWNGSSRPCYYWYYFCFHIPHVLNFYYEVIICHYILKSSQLLSWSYFCLQELQHLLTCMFLVYYHIIHNHTPGFQKY